MCWVELGEPDAVRLVGDDEVQDGPYQGEAAVLPGKRPITFVRRFTQQPEHGRVRAHACFHRETHRRAVELRRTSVRIVLVAYA